MRQDLQQLDENHAISQVRLEGGYLMSSALQLVVHPVCEGSLLHRYTHSSSSFPLISVFGMPDKDV